MPKKLFALLIVLVLAAGLAVQMAACKGDEDTDPPAPIRYAADNIYSDNGYVDYATEVYYDDEQFPELASHGLFWTKWNDTEKKMELTPADSEEGAALVDTSKPTIIMVHGMLGDSYGNTKQERFYLNGDVARSAPSIAESFGLDTDEVSLGRLWQINGWNVAYFHYNSFTSEGINFAAVEAKMWAIDGSQGMGYRTNDRELVNASEYTVSEHFAAEYIRAMKLLPDTMGDREIRVAVHSMGGVLGTTGIFLLTELADAGQLAHKQLPDRLALLDPFVGVTVDLEDEVLILSETELTIRWSGKPLYNGSTGSSMVQCIKALYYRGIVMEFYTFDLGFVPKFIAKEDRAELKKYVVHTVVEPDWNNYTGAYDILVHGHNGVRDWYFCSIAAPAVADISEGAAQGALAASAATPTQYIKDNLIGVSFKIQAGSETVPANDDQFARVN